MSNLLTAENPLVLLPSLALEFGIPEAVFLQQMHYWMQKSEKAHNGRKWVYNTVKDWQAQLYCFSEATINRAIDKLRKLGVIHVDKLAKHKSNRTNYYSLDYSKLAHIVEFANQAICENHLIKLQKPSDQIDQTDTVNLTETVLSKCTNGYTETTKEYSETTSKKKPKTLEKSEQPENQPIIGTASPSTIEPTPEQLDNLPDQHRDLWRQLRRLRLDIAHDDPRIDFWVSTNRVKHILQRVSSTPFTHNLIRSLWHTPDQIGLAISSSNWRAAA